MRNIPLVVLVLALGLAASCDRAKSEDAALAKIRELSGGYEITVAHLERTRVADADLAALKGLAHLERLELGFTRVTGQGVAALAGLPRFASR